MTDIDALVTLLDAYPVNGAARQQVISKPGGGERILTKPNKALAAWLRQTNATFNAISITWPDYIHGCKDHSYVTYARPHVGKPCLITVDIKKCFDTITKQQVADAFVNHLGVTPVHAGRLAHRVCYKGHLAQGFATSNFVCNLVLLDALAAIQAFLKPQGICFTNYVDDLALSGDIRNPDSIINQVAVILSRAGLSVKKAKVCVMPATKQQIICGLLVNKRLTLTKVKKATLLATARASKPNNASLLGWVANLKNVDPAFSAKLNRYLAV